MKYNLSEIMKRAWSLFRKAAKKAAKKAAITFGEALHRAWLTAKAVPVNAERVEAAKRAAGVTEAVNTWAAWKEAGFEVVHGSKSLFSVELIWGSRGDGASYKASFFGASQVKPLEA